MSKPIAMKDADIAFHPQQNSFVGKKAVMMWRKSSTSCAVGF